MAEQARYMLRLKPLPKAEYKLGKVLLEKYGLADMTELFAVALRVLDTVERYHLPQGNGRQGMTGEVWIEQAIDSLRSVSDKERMEGYGLE